jgi:hypothetical protein
MSTSRRTWPLRIVATVFVTLAGATGCSSILSPHSDIEISKRYPVGNHPTPECVDAAKRATYWCERGTTRADPDSQGKCLKAQWEHARLC